MTPILGTNDVQQVLADNKISWATVTIVAYEKNGKFCKSAGLINGRTKWWWRSDVEEWINARQS